MNSGRPHRLRRVGVIGESGVGKSTILNALISERLPLLPQGGVGPLTAVPIEVRHARIPYLKVGCFGSGRIEQLLEACHRYRAVGPTTATASGDVILVRRAMQIACGNQFGQKPVESICSFLEQCRGTGGVPAVSGERAHVARVRRAISSGDAGKFIEVEAGLDLPGLMTTLAEHACGPLAPLTASIELGWDAPLLADGTTLVDLPGLGVANDLHPLVTHAVAGSLGILLLVVDRSGLSDASAGLLAEVFEEHSVPAEASQRTHPTLVVAVTKLDQGADERVSHRRNLKAWQDACTAATTRARDLVRSQLASEVVRRKNAAGALMRRAVERFRVVPVFPLEYQRLHRRDPEEQARLGRAATGIPDLAAALRTPVHGAPAMAAPLR